MEEYSLMDIIYVNETELKMPVNKAIEAGIDIATMGMSAGLDDYDNRMKKMVAKVKPQYIKFKADKALQETKQ